MRALEDGDGLISEIWDEAKGAWVPPPPEMELTWGDMFRAVVGPF